MMTHFYAPIERGIFAVLLALLVWLPLPLGSNRDWSQALFVLIVGSLAGSWVVLQLVRNRPLGSGFRHALLPLGLLAVTQLWVAVQWLAGWSRDSAGTFQYLVLGLAYCLLYLLVVGLVRTRKRLTLLLSVLVVCGASQAFFGTVMTLSGVEWLLFGPKDFHLSDATGTFVNRNHLAGYLEITLACGIGLLLALREDGRFRWAGLLEAVMGPKGRLRLALVVMVVALVMSHSRMGNAAFFVSLLIVGGLFVLIDKAQRRRNSLILASVILIDMLVVSQFFGLEKLKERVLDTRFSDVLVEGQVVQRANELRGSVLTQALPLARERPLLGQGAGSFEAVFAQHAGDIPLHYDHAHNDLLQFFIEYGLLGTLPLALFVLFSLYQAFKAMRRRESLYRSGVGFGAALGIIALMIHSSTDFNLQIPANAATYVVLCAIAVLANHHRVPRPASALQQR